jgi:Protein of unknown function (DUF1761)
MPHLNYLAIVVAAIAVFVFAAGYYIALARLRAQLSAAAAATGSRPRPWLMALELFKSLVIASVVAGLVAVAGISDVAGALKLGFALWIAFPVMLLVGSVTQENVPWKLGAIHGGDWLAKLLIISVIVSVWR